MSSNLIYCKGQKDLKHDMPPEDIKNVVRSGEGVLWLDLVKPEKSEMDILESSFKLHPLTLEDCINTNTRPKIEQFENYMFIVIHAACTKPRSQRVRTTELNVCVGKNFIVTIHQEPIKGVETALERTSKNPAIISRGPDSVLHLVVDSLVDNYIPALDAMDYKLSNIETQVLANPTHKTLNDIVAAKKDILYLRRFIGPQRDTINLLSKEYFQFISHKRKAYFRDVYDNMIFINDTIDNYRDIVNGIFDAYLSKVSDRTNEIMKVLTVIATIMMPLTLISGIYGMNFRNMPLLKWDGGFYAVSFLMVLIGIGMLMYFKRKEWL